MIKGLGLVVIFLFAWLVIRAIKEELTKRGYVFHTDTDTEVLVNLIEEVQKKENTTLDNAVRIALNEVVGAYAIVSKPPFQLISSHLPKAS